MEALLWPLPTQEAGVWLQHPETYTVAPLLGKVGPGVGPGMVS